MRWFRKKAELDQRADDAREEAQAARERLHRAREEVVKPLHRAARENRFAAVIRASLLPKGDR